MKARLALLVILAFVAAPSALAASPLEIKATVDHTSVGLGDPFRYVVEGRAPKAAALTVIADAGPFTVVAPPKTTRSRHGGDSVVRVEQTLVCLDRGCAPDRTARRVALPAARAFNSSSSVTSTAAAITLVPRVPESVVAAPRAIYHRQVGVPAASTTVPPILAAVVFGLVAVLLLAAAVLLVVRGPRAVGRSQMAGRRALSGRRVRSSP